MQGPLKLAAIDGIVFPAPSAMRDEIDQALDWEGIGRERDLRQRFAWSGQVPPLPKEILDTALLQAIAAARPDETYYDPAQYLDRFDVTELQRLYAMLRWLTGSDYEAAQIDIAYDLSRHHPGLREHYRAALVERPRHQREIDSFVHAADAWEAEGRKPCWPLVSELTRPDVPLWHEIATDMYRLRGNRLEAVIWILSQRLCDRATVYRFLQGAFAFGSMADWVELKRRESPQAAEAMARALHRTIERWNTGFYHQSNLAPTLYGELEPMEGTPDIADHARACYEAYPELAALFPDRPVPLSQSLDTPDPRKLHLYSRASGYRYDTESGELRWQAGEPKLADFVSWRPRLPA